MRLENKNAKALVVSGAAMVLVILAIVLAASYLFESSFTEKGIETSSFILAVVLNLSGFVLGGFVFVIISNRLGRDEKTGIIPVLIGIGARAGQQLYSIQTLAAMGLNLWEKDPTKTIFELAKSLFYAGAAAYVGVIIGKRFLKWRKK